MKRIKEKIIEIIIGAAITSVLLWIGSYVRFIPQLKEQFPIIQTTNDRQDECIYELQATVDRINMKLHDDSIRQGK